MGWFQRLAGRRSEPGAGPSSGPGPGSPDEAGTPDPEGGVGGLVDPLTGIAGRLALNHRLAELVSSSPATGERPALLLLDLDRFGALNEAAGPASGDEVLRTIARRLAAAAPSGTAYRVGGDRFALLVGFVTAEDAVQTAEATRTAVSEPIGVDGETLEVTTSVAVVLLGDRLGADAVLRDADVALFRAKALGGDRVVLYSEQTDEWASARRTDIEKLLEEVEELRLENRMLSDAILVDPTSGLPNAAAFEADLHQLHARRVRQQDPYTVLVAAIDEFEDYASEHGRPARRHALASVAESIGQTVRQTDRAYRRTDHEFAVLLPGCDSRQGAAAAERLRARVERLALPHYRRPGGVLSVSIGVVEAGFRHPSEKDVMNEVDEQVATALRRGGNRVVWPH